MRRSNFPLCIALVLALVRCAGCGSELSVEHPDSGAGGGLGLGGGGAAGGSGGGGGADVCIAPDVLITLDRTLTMHFTAAGDNPPDTDAGHATSKWAQAIAGIQQLTAAPFDQGIRFGLELWPKQEPGCVTLAQRIEGMTATNPSCEGPEVVVPPALSTGAQIFQALDPETTPLCLSTPTGSALLGANDFLSAHRTDGGQQFIVLVTDGADWAFSCPDPDPLGVVDQIYDGGISTLIVGFSAEASVTGGVGAGFLNDMACAGHTAKGFPATCLQNDAGFWRARDPDAGLFYVATDSNELVTTLRAFGKTICCDCIN